MFNTILYLTRNDRFFQLLLLIVNLMKRLTYQRQSINEIFKFPELFSFSELSYFFDFFSVSVNTVTLLSA